MKLNPYPSYAPAELDWIEELPTGWTSAPIKALASCNDDALPETTPDDVEIEYVDISSVHPVDGIIATESMRFGSAPSRARRLVKDGDVIVSTVRTYLRAIAKIVAPPEGLVVSTGFAVVRPRTIEPAFLGHVLRSEPVIGEIIARSTGVSYPAINPSELVSIKIPVPPEADRRAISAFLDCETARIDTLIAEQRTLIERLREKRQAVISQAVTKGLNPDVPMKPSGVNWLREVPGHWEVGAIKYFVLAKNGAIKTGPFGSHLTASDMQSGTIKVYNQRNVIDEDFESGENFISWQKFLELASFETFPGDLLITTRGTIGRAAILPDNAERGILHPCLIRLQADDTKIRAKFLKILIQDSDVIKTQLAYLSNATTIEVIYSYTIASVIIPVPSIAEQDAIMRFLDHEIVKIDALIAEAETSIALLQEHRSALITAVVTGKVDVRGLAEGAPA